MKTAIIQSNYLPWKGYFDIIHSVDLFIIGDNVQYTEKDWRNRNLIKTPYGAKWITVPVVGGIHQKMDDVRIDNTKNWMEHHKRKIEASYSRALYYETYKSEIGRVFSKKFDYLSDLNIYSIKTIARLLDLDTPIINVRDFNCQKTKTEGIIEICKKVGSDYYVSGPSAKNYIDQEKLSSSNITLEYKNYEGYPEYPQLWGTFDHFVSIIDLIFNCGEKSSYYIWGWREGTEKK